MADDDTFVVGAPLPRIRSVSAHDGLRVTLTWESDGPGQPTQTIDLAPAVYRYKLYAPLREDSTLFRTVHVTDDGFAVAWGDGDDLDMASTTIAELAEEAMTPADFSAFMKRNGYTLDSVSADLGISRRLAAYYAKEREIPRTVALACRYLDKGAEGVVARSDSAGSQYFPGENVIAAKAAYDAAARVMVAAWRPTVEPGVIAEISASGLMAGTAALLRPRSLDSGASPLSAIRSVGRAESEARRAVAEALALVEEANRILEISDEPVIVRRHASDRSFRVNVGPGSDEREG